MPRCAAEAPEPFDISPGHTARCWLYADDTEARAKRAENAEAVANLTAPAS
jgi:peptide/nickel transport system ATP-binding protein